MIKKFVVLGVFLIIVGVAGVAVTGFDFGDELPYHEKQWSLEGTQLKRFIVASHSHNLDIEFVQSKDGSSHVQYSGYIEQESFDRLEKSIVSNETLKLDFKTKVKIRFFHMQFGSNHGQLVVTLPEGHVLDDIDIISTSGNLVADYLEADQLFIEARSGNVTMNHNKADRLQIETRSGNITVKDIQAETHASTHSGNIVISGIDGEGTISTHSGNINIVQRSPASLDIESRSGNVTVAASGEFRGFYDLKSNSGTIKAPESKRETQDLIKVRTHSGNIKIKE